MATTLPDYIFDYIGVTNGGWGPIEVPAIPLLVNGSSNSDDIAVTPIALSVVNGNDGNDRITIVGNLALATTLDGGRGEDQIFGGRALILSMAATATTISSVAPGPIYCKIRVPATMTATVFLTRIRSAMRTPWRFQAVSQALP
jgi:hypothetical protein